MCVYIHVCLCVCIYILKIYTPEAYIYIDVPCLMAAQAQGKVAATKPPPGCKQPPKGSVIPTETCRCHSRWQRVLEPPPVLMGTHGTPELCPSRWGLMLGLGIPRDRSARACGTAGSCMPGGWQRG